MTRLWDADHEITPEAAAFLIARQFPDLVPVQIEKCGAGWDNIAFRVNGQYLFRFPRRRATSALLRQEIRVLPLLAPHLPLPIPVPQFPGNADNGYPYPFVGYPYIPGTTACRDAWTTEERARTTVTLARFLAALHPLPITQETRDWALGDDLDRAVLAHRAPKLKERLGALAPYLRAQDIDAAVLLERVEDLAFTPLRTEPPCWVHGDLYARHLLVDAAHSLSGVIDWGDVHLGDPAIDLSIVFSFLPCSAHALFRTTYGPIDEATWRRAQFRAIHYGAVLTAYSLEVGETALLQVGEYALRNAMAADTGE